MKAVCFGCGYSLPLQYTLNNSAHSEMECAEMR